MENQPKITIDKTEATGKKLWQTPTIEVISRDNIKSGHTTGVEGFVYSPGSTGSGHS